MIKIVKEDDYGNFTYYASHTEKGLSIQKNNKFCIIEQNALRSHGSLVMNKADLPELINLLQMVRNDYFSSSEKTKRPSSTAILLPKNQ